MKKRTIAYVSGTRADFGLMSGVLAAIQKSPLLRLRLYAIGMHNMRKFGYTFDEVKSAFPTVKKIEVMIKNDSSESMSRYLSDCVTMITSEFIHHKPDLALVLGDRGEMLAVACACLYLGIPIAHIHGGDITGTVDDTVRNVITKFAHIHFSATKESANRLKTLCEEPWRIHIVGSPSLDNIREARLISKQVIYAMLHIPVTQPYILLTLHPETNSRSLIRRNIEILLSAIETTKLPVVVIYPNADPGSSVIIEALEMKRRNPCYHIYQNMPYIQFLSVAKHAAVWIGNSSAGCIESASLRVPVVNVGSREIGRIKTKNILNVPFSLKKIKKALQQSLTDRTYLRKISHARNPWGGGHAAERIAKILEEVNINQKLLEK